MYKYHDVKDLINCVRNASTDIRSKTYNSSDVLDDNLFKLLISVSSQLEPIEGMLIGALEKMESKDDITF